MLQHTFLTISLAVLQVFAIGAIGFWLRRSGRSSKQDVNFLSRLVVDVTFPAMAVSTIVDGRMTSQYADVWWLPFCCVMLLAVGACVGYLLSHGVPSSRRRAVIALVGFQNAGYLPLPLLSALLPADVAQVAHAYVFLIMLGFGPLMWSVGVWLLTNQPLTRDWWRPCLNPPFVATVGALGVTLLGGAPYIPDGLLLPVKWLGACTVPLVMIVLGGMLAEYPLFRFSEYLNGVRVAVGKLLLMPLLMTVLMWQTEWNATLKCVLLLEAAVPSAMTLAIVARHYHSVEEEFVVQTLALTYVLSLLTIPVFFILSGVMVW